MEFIAVDYNQSLKPLEALLSRISRGGDFYAVGTIELPLPRIEVEGIGPLSFPIPQAQVDALVRQAQRAPYGKGLDTITDTSVRKVWQIAPGKVRIGGKSWAATFETILSKVRTGLGCEKVTISAELYKLLIYDRGGFFLPHRDTEKADGMFGTLVITLPSLHRGGELRVRHAGREVTVDTSAADFSELSYVAFYADCEHEALPVREGNRVCLVYNLIGELRKSKARKLLAPDHEFEIAGIAELLERSLQAPDAAVKIAWLLSHQYSPAGLSFSALKGTDAARADVLVRAAECAQCAVHLGLVHIGESGAAEPEYADWDNGARWDRYSDDENDEDEPDEQDADDEDFAVVTVDDGWRFIDQWCDTEDRETDFGRIPLGEGELLPEGALDDEKPDTQKLTEATGNEGASYERSYHRAVLVVWRRDRYADVLLQGGAVACLPYLDQLVAARSASRVNAVAVAGRMIDVWNARSSDGILDDEEEDEERFASQRVRMLDALGRLGDSARLEQFVVEVLTLSHDGSENGALLASLHVLSHDRAAALLAELVAARMPHCPNGVAKLVLALSAQPARRYSSVAEAAVASLDRIGVRIAELPALRWDSFGDPQQPTAEFVEDLLTALQRFGSVALSISAAQRIAARPDVFDPVAVVTPALVRIDAGRRRKKVAIDAGFTNLWTDAAAFLLERSATTPQPPTDWRQDVRIACSCADCKALEAFARDAVAQVHRLRVRKERRQHLHQAIDRHRLDMTHVTDRVGSPQTLVCTKDRRSFERRMAEYRSDVAAMRALVGIAPPLESVEGLSARMQKVTASAK